MQKQKQRVNKKQEWSNKKEDLRSLERRELNNIIYKRKIIQELFCEGWLILSSFNQLDQIPKASLSEPNEDA